ncbi:DUF4347 domain-containing protein [Nostoc sphaeroides CHAB 2801]|uniref:DUF4347 domain-containing protein n=1 Tax=Nostoc sphaeroides TaxID=446679 RepID=UPI000E5284DD|nr:DUF4347 domain-containing protein [Nostoc sphaeroides]MCC5628859.1 DUF4347 domain-containing protein [Nostoc sphaeroides CHAB 2801]
MTLKEASTNIVFIDTAVIDYQSLLAGIILGSEVVILDHNQDALTQITEFLAGRKSNSVQSVHIVSHGGVGSLQLGSTDLNLTNLNSYTNQLQKWRNALTDNVDILLYGCDVASGEGTKFVQLFSQITGADVAASTDKTGSAALGGNWDLEVKTGKIEANLAFQPEVIQAYNSILPASFTGISYSQNFNSLANSGTSIPWADDSTIAGWYATRTIYDAGIGSDNTDGLYSFGSTSATERSLGSIASGTTGTIYYGLRLTNNTGSPITALKVGYTGEQWRNGNNLSQQELNFSYQTGLTLTSLTTGTWKPVTSLDFTGPIATATPGSLDGNAAANRVSITPIVFNLATPIVPGEEIILRWEDLNDAGFDHGFAIDDVSVISANDLIQYAISTNTLTLTEGNSGTQSVTFTVARSGGIGVASTVDYAITGTAIFDSDYKSILIRSGEISQVGEFIDSDLSGTLNFDIGEKTKTITVDILADKQFELDENISVTLSNPNLTAAPQSSTIAASLATVDIINDDQQPTIGISDVLLSEGNAGLPTNGKFNVTLSNASYQQVIVNYNTNDGTAKVSDLDYNSGLGTLIFNPGETLKTVSFGIKGDDKPEANETFSVNLFGASNATITDSLGVATIINDDINQIPSIKISNVSVAEGSTGMITNVNFAVTLSNAIYQQVIVNYSTSDRTAKTSDSDYNSGMGAIIFNPGETSKILSIGVRGDRKVEGNETFFVNLYGAANAIFANNQGVATIINDDR